MPIPRHKCLRGLCDPEEGIHCLPDFYRPDNDLSHWQRAATLTDLEVIKVQQDSDVTPRMKLPVDVRGNFTVEVAVDYVGYLIWVREKGDL